MASHLAHCARLDRQLRAEAAQRSLFDPTLRGLRSQLRDAAVQQAQQQQARLAAQQAYLAQQQQMQQQERLNASGSAMQQLRSTSTGG